MLINRFRLSPVSASAFLLLGGCGGGEPGGGAESAAVTVVAAPTAAAPTPAPTPSATASDPASDAEAAGTRRLATLPRLQLSDMALWNWNGRWHASEWGNWMGPLPWKYDHVAQKANGDTVFTLDATGAPQLMAQNGTPGAVQGMWEADVTLPTLKDGVVVAPLWLYDGESKDEIDFELAGRKGLDVTLHASVNGVMQHNSVRLFAGRDMSGERHRYGIKMNQSAGYVEMYVDGQRVHRWTRKGKSAFVSHPMKPVIEMWAANPDDAGFVSWVGRWTGLAPNQALTMTVHGYGYAAAP